MATYIREKESYIKIAISDGNDKPSLFLFQLGNEGMRKICALWGHGYPVFSLRGNWQFLIDSATSYPDLVQETVSGAEIKESGFISAMDI